MSACVPGIDPPKRKLGEKVGNKPFKKEKFLLFEKVHVLMFLFCSQTKYSLASPFLPSFIIIISPAAVMMGSWWINRLGSAHSLSRQATNKQTTTASYVKTNGRTRPCGPPETRTMFLSHHTRILLLYRQKRENIDHSLPHGTLMDSFNYRALFPKRVSESLNLTSLFKLNHHHHRHGPGRNNLIINRRTPTTAAVLAAYGTFHTHTEKVWTKKQGPLVSGVSCVNHQKAATANKTNTLTQLGI